MRKRLQSCTEPCPVALSTDFLTSILNAKCRLSGLDLSIDLTPGVESVVAMLYSLIHRSLNEQTSTSVVVLGARGSGKSVAVDRALAKCTQESTENFEVVRLSGLLHTETGAGYERIARAFGGGGEGVGRALAVIGERIEELRKKEVGLVLVLDDFERFVGGGQEVLYNLMNAVQCRELSSIVIGMSSKIDAVDGLEKRVKSRFSQRQVVVPCPSCYDECSTFFEEALIGTDDNRVYCERARKLLADSRFREVVNSQLLINNSLGRIIRIINFTLDSMTLDGKMNPKDVVTAISSLGGAPSTDVLANHPLQNISVLELCLLTALARLEHKNKSIGQGGTFHDVYAEYENLKVGGNQGWGGGETEQKIYGKELALKGWERLIDTGLARWPGKGRKEMRLVHLNIEHAEIHRALKAHKETYTVLERWGSAWLE